MQHGRDVTAPFLTLCSPIVLLRKQDSAGVRSLGYIYPHPAAQLLSFSQLQTAGAQAAFQKDHFLVVFILDFSKIVSTFFFFKEMGEENPISSSQVGEPSSLQPLGRGLFPKWTPSRRRKTHGNSHAHPSVSPQDAGAGDFDTKGPFLPSRAE